MLHVLRETDEIELCVDTASLPKHTFGYIGSITHSFYQNKNYHWAEKLMIKWLEKNRNKLLYA